MAALTARRRAANEARRKRTEGTYRRIASKVERARESEGLYHWGGLQLAKALVALEEECSFAVVERAWQFAQKEKRSSR